LAKVLDKCYKSIEAITSLSLNADDTKVLHKYDKIPELVHMDPASTLAVLKPQN